MPTAKEFWDEHMRKHPHVAGHEVLEAYAEVAVLEAVQRGELLPVSNDGKRVFVDGVGDCAIDFGHRLDEDVQPKD
jgi:hypothetical protein